MKKANRNQTTFSSKPLGVTAWIFLANKFVNSLKTVSMYLRIGLPKNSSHAALGRLELFLRWALRVQTHFFQEVLVVVVGVGFVGQDDRAFGQV